MFKFWLNSPLYDEADDGKGGGGDDKKTPPKDDKLDRETESALSLYRALADPETGTEIVEMLARKAGLLGKDGDPKKPEDKSSTKVSRAAEKIKSKLGKDYEKFAESFGPALDDILEERISEVLQNVNNERAEVTFDTAVDKFLENHELTPEVEEQMKDLMEDSPPNVNRKGFNIQKYLTRMYNNACEELDVEPKANKGKTKSKRDADELPDFVVKDAPKGASLDDAVEAALQGIRFRRRA